MGFIFNFFVNSLIGWGQIRGGTTIQPLVPEDRTGNN